MFLLDVNTLLALSDDTHRNHNQAHRWLQAISGPACVCPIVQLGFVRVASNPRYAGGYATPAAARDVLKRMMTWAGFGFIADDVDIASGWRDGPTHPLGHQQVTDAYLLALCRKHNLKLATLDRKLAKTLAAGEPHLLELI